MGIVGLWEEVERALTLQTTTLAEESAKCVKANGRPLRIAVDASVIIWKLRESTRKALEHGGMNHPSRTFMATACNLMTQGVHAIYVFDGPGRPAIKRDKSRPTAITPKPYVPPKSAGDPKRDTEQEFGLDHVVDLAKRVLDLMGIPRWDAPGEAEAECVALEKAGIVDGIYTSDGDALAFGGRCVYRPREYKKGRDYIQKIQAADLEAAGLSTTTIILATLMAGGDYDHGIRNCGFTYGLKIARESNAAKMLHGIAKANVKDEMRIGMLDGWRKSQREAFVGQVRDVAKGKSLDVPVSWPSAKVLGLYIRPKTCDTAVLEQMRDVVWQTKDIEIKKLRSFTASMFAWRGRQRAKQFLCRLTPALVARDLMAAGCQGEDIANRLVEVIAKQQRKNTSNEPSLVKVKFMPLGFAPINYHGEPLLEGFAWRHGEGDRKDPGQPYEEEYPEFLVRFGAPSSLPTPAAAKGKGKRLAEKDTSTSSAKKAKTAKRGPLQEATNSQSDGLTGLNAERQTTPSSTFKRPKDLDLSMLED